MNNFEATINLFIMEDIKKLVLDKEQINIINATKNARNALLIIGMY
jgi:hypothetical protein